MKQYHGTDVKFVQFGCPLPGCGELVNVRADEIDRRKSTRCLAHLKVCMSTAAAADPRVCGTYKGDSLGGNTTPSFTSTKRVRPEPSFTSVIYKLIFIPENKAVYTGKTRREHKRLAEHASRSSKCRLVRNGFRKHGRKSFRLEVQLRCDDADADANESLMIVKNNTMYPNGYNLRHGSVAGDDEGDQGGSSALIASCTGVVPFQGAADELQAESEACADLADVLHDLDETKGEDVDGLLREMIRQVHPDRQTTEKTYTAEQVTAMLNGVREVLS